MIGVHQAGNRRANVKLKDTRIATWLVTVHRHR